MASKPSTLTIRQVCRALDVTAMSIFYWQKGSRLRQKLRVRKQVVGGATRISISEPVLVDWLGKYRPDLLRLWQRKRTKEQRRSRTT
jgi:hypothetical protein